MCYKKLAKCYKKYRHVLTKRQTVAQKRSLRARTAFDPVGLNKGRSNIKRVEG